ncbi:MAG: hypothetical protein K1X94_26490 [Sandaracinaceae bacterium]|nr:hypothetical protein [Sandaracinaceae bacterium]
MRRHGVEDEEAKILDELEGLGLPPPSVVRARLPDGATITIASPCPERWVSMVGDDRVRHCSRCDKPVYNLGAMSAAEVSALYSGPLTPCVRFFRREDGAVMTSDCHASRPRRVMLRVLGAVALAVGAIAFAEGLESLCYRGRIDPTTSTGGGPITS